MSILKELGIEVEDEEIPPECYEPKFSLDDIETIVYRLSRGNLGDIQEVGFLIRERFGGPPRELKFLRFAQQLKS